MSLEKDLDSKQSESILLLKQRLSGLETEEGRLKGLNYLPTMRDVGISTTPKAGTTWMQQICHQLRTQGDMNFSEISETVPFLELAYDQGQDLAAPQYGDATNELRFFKTHAWEEHCPRFPKTIVVIRDPFDVLLSFYRFFEGWFFEPGTVDLDAFADEFWLARGVPTSKMENASYFVHLISWYKRRNDKNLLLVCFEHLKHDLKGQIKRIADFLAELDPRYKEKGRIEAAVSHSTYEFMKKHANQFDEKLSKLSRNEACGLPKEAGLDASKIRSGISGAGREVLSEKIRNKIDEKWKETVEPITKCANYEELCHQLAKASSSD